MADRIALTVPEAAQALGIGRNTVYELVASDAIPYVRIGRTIRIPTASLNRWLEAQTNPNGANPQ